MSSSSPSRTTKRLKTQQASLTSFFGAPKAASVSSSSASALAAAAKKPDNDDLDKTMKNQTTGKTTTTTISSSSNSSTTIDAIIPTAVRWNAAAWGVHQNAVLYKPTGPCRDRVAAFDMDGTLVTWRTTAWPSKLTDYELWNAAVLDKLRTLYDKENYQLVIISNQGAIRSAFTGKKATSVKSLMEWLAAMIDRPVSFVMSTDKKKGFHKPNVALWQAAQKLVGSKESPWSIAESFYVGDSVGDDNDPQGGVDIGLARNVSEVSGQTLKFYTPDAYFGPSHAQQRQNTVTVKPVPPEVLATRAALVSGTYLKEKEKGNGPMLLLLCGAQGSGKSTVAQRLVDSSKDERWVAFAQDTIRNGKPGKREQVEAAVAQAVKDGKCVIVDRMHLDPSQREHFVQLAKHVGVPIHALVLSPPKAVLAQRVKERNNHPGKVQGESGARMATASADKLVFPTHEEGFALVSATSCSDSGVERLVKLYQNVGDTSSEMLPIPTKFTLTTANETKNEEAPRPLPAVLLGTMGLGRREAEQIVKAAFEIGVCGVDTAPTYKNEDKIGGVLPKDAYVIVKVPKRASAPAEVHKELEQSLTSLQRQKADLLLLHWPSLPSDTLKQVWEAMENAVQQGKAQSLGICNANVAALAGLLPQCRIPPAVLQIERHPLLPQWDLVDFCAQKDIQIQAHTPLAQGNADLLQHEVVKKVAAGIPNASPAQVVLAWNLQQGVGVTPKASNADHLREMMDIPRLNSKDLQALNDITDRKRFVAPPFMYGPAAYCWGKQTPK